MKRLGLLSILGLLVLAAGGCLEWNEAPVASFTRSPASGVAPLAVFFDASESADPDGAVASYEWDFGDGVADSIATGVAAGTASAVRSSATGVTATHTFESPGTYSVTLTVVDDRGKSAESVRNVDVAASDVPPPVGTEMGNLAPPFLLPDVRTGDSLSLADFRGYVVLLEFWRSTCVSCRSSMPAVEALRAKYAADGLRVILVSQDVTAEEARALLDGQGYDDFIAVHDADQSVRTLYDVELIPRLFVIDRQGIVRHMDHPVRIRDRHITPWL